MRGAEAGHPFLIFSLCESSREVGMISHAAILTTYISRWARQRFLSLTCILMTISGRASHSLDGLWKQSSDVMPNGLSFFPRHSLVG